MPAERDAEHGGVICSECGWSLGGRNLDTATQSRQHAESDCPSAADAESPSEWRRGCEHDWDVHAEDGCHAISRSGCVGICPCTASRPVVPSSRVDEPDDLVVPRELLEALADPDDCWFDHHGGCQAHGYISLRQGEECPQHELKRRLAVRDA